MAPYYYTVFIVTMIIMCDVVVVDGQACNATQCATIDQSCDYLYVQYPCCYEECY
jgi:hypothetical protein